MTQVSKECWDKIKKSVKEAFENPLSEQDKRRLGIRSPSGIAARKCTSCRKYKTMECPNSAECFSTIHKPHFEAW